MLGFVLKEFLAPEGVWKGQGDGNLGSELVLLSCWGWLRVLLMPAIPPHPRAAGAVLPSSEGFLTDGE